MANKLNFISFHIKEAVDVLSSDVTIDEKALDMALYSLMCISDVHPISFHIEQYYELNAMSGFELHVMQNRVRNKTVKLLHELNELLCKDFTNKARVGEKVCSVIKTKNLRSAREYYHYLSTPRAYKREFEGFDFDVYRMTKSVSKLSDLHEIHGYSTKMILLQIYLVDAINEVLEEVYKALIRVEVIIDNGSMVHDINDFSKISSSIISICSNKQQDNQPIGDIDDKREKLKKYCKIYPTPDSNLKSLIKTLEELKDRYEIPFGCSKKKFSAIVYILYRCQGHIGMKPHSFKVYSKFKNLMCDYFEVPQNTYKENDIADLAKDIAKDIFFINYKYDAK